MSFTGPSDGSAASGGNLPLWPGEEEETLAPRLMAAAAAAAAAAAFADAEDDVSGSEEEMDGPGPSHDLPLSSREGWQGSSHYSDLDLSHKALADLPSHYTHPTSAYHPRMVKSLSLHHNAFAILPPTISVFTKIVALDLSSNQLTRVPDALCRLRELKVLLLKSNQLEADSFPKAFPQLTSLEVLNVSGNLMEELPDALLALFTLKALYCGGNRLRDLSPRIGSMLSLEILYLGGNKLREIPESIGHLRRLTSLVLCDNRLDSIPDSVACLQRLESLSLHNNQLKTLPTDLVKLDNLQQLSLRSNPLVARFVRDMGCDVPSLMELAGRIVKVRHIPYSGIVPRTVAEYLDTSHRCVNPKCKGVYFEAKVEHVKFVDFCGKYRVPLLQYLCSTQCETVPMYAKTDASSDEADVAGPHVPAAKLKRVLLG